MNSDVLDKIREIIADITGNPLVNITAQSDSRNVEGWDSVAQINIVVTIEMEFSVSFSAEEMQSLSSVRQICAALQHVNFSPAKA